ncbi:MAG: hypothetical protein ACOC2W_02125 [bacterium]
MTCNEIQLVKKMAKDVANNFKDITGYEPIEVIDSEETFLQDKIDETITQVSNYVKDKYNPNDKVYEEFLYEVDKELMNVAF